MLYVCVFVEPILAASHAYVQPCSFLQRSKGITASLLCSLIYPENRNLVDRIEYFDLTPRTPQ